MQLYKKILSKKLYNSRKIKSLNCFKLLLENEMK